MIILQHSQRHLKMFQSSIIAIFNSPHQMRKIIALKLLVSGWTILSFVDFDGG